MNSSLSHFPYEPYSAEIKEEALQRLSAGQKHHEVSRLMGVTMSSLICWELEAEAIMEGSLQTGKHRVYPEAIRKQVLGWLEQGQSVNQIKKLSGVSEGTVYRWQRQAKLTGEPSPTILVNQ